MSERVMVVRCGHYEISGIERALAEALDGLDGLARFVAPGERVLVKPNMLEGLPPERGVTTHPEVVRAVIRAVAAVGGLPVVGDSPALEGTVKTAEKNGIARICREEHVPLVPFEARREYPCPDGLRLKRFTLAEELAKADKVISVAKMKTHSLTGITGAVKNLFGFVVNTDKAQFHLRMNNRDHFSGMLVDLCRTVRPALTVVDGVVGMEGRGPRNGQLVQAGVLLAGANPFAVDCVMATVMGFAPRDIRMLSMAIERGFTPPPEQIAEAGSGAGIRLVFARAVRNPALHPRFETALMGWGQRHLAARPVIAGSCVGCGRCAEHCPPGVITMENGRAVIDYRQCIRCYCCQELCPADAVRLEEGLVLKTVNRLTGRRRSST